MSFLGKFTKEETDLIIALPFRAGLWVSEADDTGDFVADDQEMRALEEILNDQAQGFAKSAAVHEIITATYERKPDWKNWIEKIETFPQECQYVISFMNTKLEDRDIQAFGETLMEIGVEVAAAFREYDQNASLFSRMGTGIKIFLDKIIGVFKGEAYESSKLLKISFEEDLALSMLSESINKGMLGEAKP